jgi:predicted RNase H-like HicB family nuclease
MAIRGYITLTLEAYPEGRTFVSRCKELGVTSCGDSPGEALEAVRDAVATYLNAIEQLGDRERIFAEKGIDVRKTKPRHVDVVAGRFPPNSFSGSVVVSIAA